MIIHYYSTSKENLQALFFDLGLAIGKIASAQNTRNFQSAMVELGEVIMALAQDPPQGGFFVCPNLCKCGQTYANLGMDKI